MAQPQLTASEIADRLGIKSNVFDKTAELSSSGKSKLFDKFNGHEGDEYMLIFGAGISKLTDTNQQLSAENLKSTEKQTAILAIAKSLEGMKDLGNMLKFLDQMLITFKNNPSITSWIKEQVNNVRNGVLSHAGKAFYWQLMAEWEFGKGKIAKWCSSTLAFVLYNCHNSTIEGEINAYIQKHPNLSESKLDELKEYKSVLYCFHYKDHGTTWGFGHKNIEPDDRSKIYQLYMQHMRAAYGTGLSSQELKSAFFETNFKVEAFGWIHNHHYASHINIIYGEMEQALNIDVRKVAGTSKSFATKSSDELSLLLNELESVTSSDEQLSVAIKNLIVNPKNLSH